MGLLCCNFWCRWQVQQKDGGKILALQTLWLVDARERHGIYSCANRYLSSLQRNLLYTVISKIWDLSKIRANSRINCSTTKTVSDHFMITERNNYLTDKITQEKFGFQQTWIQVEIHDEMCKSIKINFSPVITILILTINLRVLAHGEHFSLLDFLAKMSLFCWLQTNLKYNEIY